MTANTVPAELASACPAVSAAGLGGGSQARYVAAPASTAQAAAVLRAAAGLGLTVLPRGSGSKLDWGGAPPDCDLIVDTGRLDQIVEHAAGDLVVTVQAGALLADVDAVLALAGQRLALDPPAPGPASAGLASAGLASPGPASAGLASPGPAGPGGTIGGVIATGAAGPLRYRYGSPRDLLIGITVVRADGTVTRSGGKVVKNVAGYDLGKLYAGSYGTLGLITEATFRLHPRPGTTRWITVECTGPPAAAAIVQVMADAPLAPAAIELDWPGADAPISVSVLLEGDAASVAARADRMAVLVASGTDGSDGSGGARGTVGLPSGHTKRPEGSAAHPALADGTWVRVAFWAAQLPAVLEGVRKGAARVRLDPRVAGSAAAGLLDVQIAPDAPAADVARFVDGLRSYLADLGGVEGMPPVAGSVVVVRAPAAVLGLVAGWGELASAGLMRAVKEQFDPEHRMAPGRFAGGI